MSGRPELIRRIRAEIERAGPMSFDRFMELALYEPGLGYYASLSQVRNDDVGTLADFQTSPQVHPVFGYLVARYLRRLWDALERPEPFVIAEPGAGAGELARQILARLAAEDGPRRVEYHAVEARPRAPSPPTPSPSARERGLESDVSVETPLPRLGEGVGGEGAPRWWGSLDALRQARVTAHCVVSNEFFDALPVHRVAWLDGRLREVYVDWGERGFVERIGDLSDEALAPWIQDGGIAPPEGWRGEICLRLAPTVEAISAIVDRGVVLSIDYGHETAELFDPAQSAGTLLAYYRHQWSDELLERVGEQDLTSHVDFGALQRLGRRAGLEPCWLTTQREFLLRLGLVDEVERWLAREPTPGKRWQARFSLSELSRPDGLGRLKVLAQGRGLPTHLEPR